MKLLLSEDWLYASEDVVEVDLFPLPKDLPMIFHFAETLQFPRMEMSSNIKS